MFFFINSNTFSNTFQKMVLEWGFERYKGEWVFLMSKSRESLVNARGLAYDKVGYNHLCY